MPNVGTAAGLRNAGPSVRTDCIAGEMIFLPEAPAALKNRDRIYSYSSFTEREKKNEFNLQRLSFLSGNLTRRPLKGQYPGEKHQS